MQLVQNAAAEKEIIQFLPVEKKNSICWLDMFWSMVAGLSWFKLVLIWS